MDQQKSVKRKKAAGTSRGVAEGDSIMQKRAFKSTPTTKVASESGKKGLGKKHKLPDAEWDVDDNAEQEEEEMATSVSSKRARVSSDSINSEIDLDQSVSPQIKKKKKAKKAEKALKKTRVTEVAGETEAMETDVSFEQAVERARGLPDGSLGDSPAKNDSIEEDDTDSKKDKKFEKGKKKPLNVIAAAAKKLKQISSGIKGDDVPTTKKRRIEDGDKGNEENGEEKVKPEHLKRKERKTMRQSKEHTNYDLSMKAKAVWNELRRMDLKSDRRVELSNQLYDMVKGKTKKLIFAHDTSRVIQCLIKYGTQAHKDAVFHELKGEIVPLCKSQYAKFFVRRLLKYGTKAQRNHVFTSFYGHVRKLIRHKNACEILEVAYNDYANAQQRAALVEEFYGPSFALFKTGEVRSLEQIMKCNPEKRDTILSNMKESLSVLAEKAVLQYSIVHRVFWEYFMYASAKLRSEMIEALREGLIHMLHTRDGARVAMFCLWHGTAKDRKLIVKSMKTYVVKICREEHGHLVLLALLDVVDDTKLVSKAILDELLKSVLDVAKDQYGRKVLLYLLAPRDSKHFHPDIVKVLKEGDDNANSKKLASVRRAELLDHVSKPLVKFIADNAQTAVTDPALVIILFAIISKVKCDPTTAMRAISTLAAEPFSTSSVVDGGVQHVVEHTAGHLMLKRLILNDAERIKAGQEVLFSMILLDVLPEGALKSWAACNRGCFTLCRLIELKHLEVTAAVKQALHGIAASLAKMDFKGAQVLLAKLQV